MGKSELWEIVGDDSLSGIEFINIEVDGVGSVAWVMPADPDKGIQAEDRDRARLIAAAPELLAALERAIPHIGVGYSGIQRASVMKDVRAAIAKARGTDKSAVPHYQEQARLLTEEKED